MCCRQADAGFISNYSKTKKCSESESAGGKIHEFAITIPVVLPDKDYPPATRQDLRLENCSDRLMLGMAQSMHKKC